VSAMFWQVAPVILAGAIGWLELRFWESRKKLRFRATDWTFQYLKVDTEFGRNWVDKTETELTRDIDKGSSVRYVFTAKIFNKKSESTGLDELSVVFMKGKGLQRQILFQHEDLCDASAPVSMGSSSPKLGEMQLPSRELSVKEIVAYPEWKAILRETESIWFFARGPSGKRYSWKVTDISQRLGVPQS
jgi:hypothetical protein